MTDELEVRGGGAVVVDTESVRHAASGFETAAAMCADAAAELGRLAGMLAGLVPFACDEAAARARAGAIQSEEAQVEAADLARRLRVTAGEYERVELEAARAAVLAAGDEQLARLLAGRIRALWLTAPVGSSALPVTDAEALPWQRDLIGQWMQASPLGPLGFAIAATGVAAHGAVERIGAGTVPGVARLRGTPPGVRVFPVATARSRGSSAGKGASGLAAAAAPDGLASVVARVPGAGLDRVRVERYRMADGSSQFAVYVAGTQSVGASDTEAWDLGSNLSLYTGEVSASYEATVEALRQAGAGPDDPVHAFGYSQGGMIASRLALEDGFTVSTLVTFGSPVEADVGADTLSVAVRHSDDPVAALVGEGFAAGVGGPGSFVAERHGDPVGGIVDVLNPIRAHGLEVYAETAGMLDASTDPRMGAVRGVFAELGDAASVDLAVFGAERLAETDDPGETPLPAVHRGR